MIMEAVECPHSWIVANGLVFAACFTFCRIVLGSFVSKGFWQDQVHLWRQPEPYPLAVGLSQTALRGIIAYCMYPLPILLLLRLTNR